MSAHKVLVLLLFIFCPAHQFSFLPKAEKFVSTNVIKTVYNTADKRAAKCRQWFAVDRGVAHLRLPRCPPTEQQAKRNGTFAEDKSPPHVHHPGADRCFRSSANFWASVWQWARTGDDPGGQQCCYRNGQLITDGTEGAGTADRGSLLWNHWWHDVLPSYYCCMDGDQKMCSLYLEKRPIDTGHDKEEEKRRRDD
ncbi:hypothetical protein niasHT_032413 [Heterodera trifolii]|uniref:AMOP domain-containing protein n=1 Tax=Heterodera trifolii TaxID=157864 RepID=A0ABD2IBU8_9BILA